MSPRRLLTLFALALIITVAIAAPTQAPQGTAYDSTNCPTILANEVILDMVSAKPSEVSTTKTQTSETNLDLSTHVLVELNNDSVSTNILKAMRTPKSVQREKKSQIHH